MQVKKNALIAMAALALAGGALLAGAPAPAGNAATAACGSACKAPFARQWGVNLIGAVRSGIPRVGQAAVLYPAAPRNAEDWQFLYQGTVAAFYEEGIVGAAVGKTWPSYPAYEYEYTPAGTPTSLCLGTAVTAGPGTPLTLQPCGSTARTLWIPLLADRSGGYVPLISGSDTLATSPYVMTGNGPDANLTTAGLVKVATIVDPVQMWANVRGVI